MLEKARHNKYPSNLTRVEKSGKKKAMSDEIRVYRGIKEYRGVVSIPYLKVNLEDLGSQTGQNQAKNLAKIKCKCKPFENIS